ncbi:MAG: ABC transporter substrate-binding protein, partial [Pseudomonadota bacterium]
MTLRKFTRRAAGQILAFAIATSTMVAVAPSDAQADDNVLRIAHPSFSRDWSPMRGGGEIYRWNSLWWASPRYFDEN